MQNIEFFVSYLKENSFLSRKYNFLYVATPKVACTAIKWFIAEIEGFDDKLHKCPGSDETLPELVIHDKFSLVAPHMNGLDLDNLLIPLVSDDYYKFCFVRNPFTRLFSAWQSKVLLREPLQINDLKGYSFYNIEVNSQDKIAYAFEQFLVFVYNQMKTDSVCDIHWMPQYDLLRPDIVKYSDVFKIEDKSANSNLIEKFDSNLNIDGSVLNKRTNQSVLPYSKNFYTDKSKSIVEELYEIDFYSFGYSYEIPEGVVGLFDGDLTIALKAIDIIQRKNDRMSQIIQERNDSFERIRCLESDLSWQKEQTDKYWCESQQLKTDFLWQKDLADKNWSDVEKLQYELNQMRDFVKNVCINVLSKG